MNGQQTLQRGAYLPGYIFDDGTGFYIPGPYKGPRLLLGQSYGAFPHVPAGTALDCMFHYAGATGTNGISALSIVSTPANGPIWLDGQQKANVSSFYEIYVENQDASLNLNIMVAGNTAQGAPVGGYVVKTMAPGTYWSESARQFHPAVLSFKCATANTSINILVNLFCYGSNY